MRKHDEFNQTTALGEIKVTVIRHEIATPPSLNVPYEGRNPAGAGGVPARLSTVLWIGPGLQGIRPRRRARILLPHRPWAERRRSASRARRRQQGQQIVPCARLHSRDRRAASQRGGRRAAVEHADPERGRQRRLRLAAAARHDRPLGRGARARCAAVRSCLSKAVFSAKGIDSEAIAFDPAGKALWVTDEYGPFLLRIDPLTGVVSKRYGPGTGLLSRAGQAPPEPGHGRHDLRSVQRPGPRLPAKSAQRRQGALRRHRPR
ncbi:esterase-like activity of phytase family protein [Massilia sp. B-10]|nr:esterase-like activity of phytase family protein [Massilia sp. B-10]